MHYLHVIFIALVAAAAASPILPKKRATAIEYGLVDDPTDGELQ